MPEPRGRLDADLLRGLCDAAGGSVEVEAPLAEVTRWKVGGPAAALVTAGTAEEVQAVAALMRSRPEPFLVVGQTANLLFDSDGFDGVLLRLGGELGAVSVEGELVRAGAAAPVREVAEAAAAHGLTGIEHSVGVPGTIGGLVVMNGGTQRRGIGENTREIEVLDADLELRTMSHEEARFSYRSSLLQRNGAIVVGVVLELSPGDRDGILAAMAAILQERARKFPEDEPNCGSTFLSDPAMYDLYGPPGKVIEDAGLKGYTVGGAQVSPLHANFINNIGGATSDDVLRVIWEARTRVLENTGYGMNCEVRFVFPSGEMVPAHEAAERRWAASDSAGA